MLNMDDKENINVGSRNRARRAASVLKGLAETAPTDEITAYFTEIGRVCSSVAVSDGEGRPLDLAAGFHWIAEHARGRTRRSATSSS